MFLRGGTKAFATSSPRAKHATKGITKRIKCYKDSFSLDQERQVKKKIGYLWLSAISLVLG